MNEHIANTGVELRMLQKELKKKTCQKKIQTDLIATYKKSVTELQQSRRVLSDNIGKLKSDIAGLKKRISVMKSTRKAIVSIVVDTLRKKTRSSAVTGKKRKRAAPKSGTSGTKAKAKRRKV